MFQFLSRMAFEVEVMLTTVATFFKRSADAYVEIETSDDPLTLVATDGALISLLEIAGNSEVRAGKDFDGIVQVLQMKLGSYLKKGTRYAFFFESETNKELIERRIKELSAPSFATAKRLGLDLSDVMLERSKTLAGHVQLERTFLAIYTEPSTLSAADKSRGNSAAAAVRSKLPMAVHSQNLSLAMPGLREAHRSLRDALLSDLIQAGYTVEATEVHDWLYGVRKSLDPSWTPDDDGSDVSRRLINLPGDKAVQFAPPDLTNPGADMSNMLWPSVPVQVLPRGIEFVGLKFVKVGSRTFFPMLISVPPKVLFSFDSLFSRLRETKIPWRIAFHITPDPTKSAEIGARKVAAMFVDRSINKAIEEAEGLATNGKNIVGIRITVCTWVDNDNLEDLSVNGSRLARAVQSWGSIEVNEHTGNPAAVLFGLMPGMNRFSGAPMACAPLEDVCALLPVTRSASPFTRGSMLLRSPDGKIFLMEMFSSLQKARLVLMYAPPRSGKSVMLSSYIVATAVMPGLERLPLISIIDIGTSSSGPLSLLSKSLPSDQQHLVQYKRLRNTRDCQINPFDTPLGCRTPVSPHRAFLRNFITLITDEKESSLPSVAAMCIDLSYKQKYESPNRYTSGIENEIDQAIEDYQIEIDVHTTWWELVDRLFELKQYRLAILAQRYAVPLLVDICGMASSKEVREEFRGAARDGQPITEYFAQCVRSAISLYRILGGITKLDFGEARIVSLDLADVAPSGGTAEAIQQTTAMYMLARHVLVSNQFLHVDHVSEMTEAYRPYHMTQIVRTSSDPKILALDELHRTGQSKSFLAQLEQDAREGPKANISMLLLSQRLSDFPEPIVAMATTIIVLGLGSDGPRQTIQTFALKESVGRTLMNLGTPTAAGSNMLLKIKTDLGWHVQPVVNTISATESWAFSTTKEDSAIRDRLYQLLGARLARSVLSKKYPQGNAASEILRRRAQMEATRSQLSEDDDNSIVAGIIEELVEESKSIPH